MFSCPSGATRKVLRVVTIVLVFCFAIFPSRPANAQLSLILLPDTQTGSPGEVITFNARLTNLNPETPLYLNSIEFNIPFPSSLYLTPDDTPFFFAVPPALSSPEYPGAVYEGPLFNLQLADTIPLNTLEGDVAILGGAIPSTLDNLGIAHFIVNVNNTQPAVPEPSAVWFILLGLPAVLVSVLKRVLYRVYCK